MVVNKYWREENVWLDTLLIFDNVLIPWENVLFHRSLESAAYIRSTLHRYSAFNYTLRMLRRADYLIGVAMLNVEQTGLTHLQAVKEKISKLINIAKESMLI